MTTYPASPRKRYGLLVLATILLVFAGVCLYAGAHSRFIRDLGVLAILASVQLVRLARTAGRTTPSVGEIQRPTAGTQSGPGRLLWAISILLVPLLLGSFFLLHIDAANGGHYAWAADVFAGVGLVCAVVWGALVVKVRRG